jgi:uncharacterized membrane protein
VTDPDTALWEEHAQWWQQGFSEGADAEYEEQILPLAAEHLAGATRLLDVGTGEGQIAALPAVFLGLTAVFRYLYGHASIDLVVFDQGIWAASRTGHPWVSVIGESLLGDHFGPGILVFSPLYRIVASPIWLLAGQALAAWVAVRLIARRLAPAVGDCRAGLVAGALLLSPPVAYALLFDVHGVVFAVPFALAALLALEDGRPRAAFLFGLAAALFRVEIGAAVVVAFAVWPGRRRGRLLPAAALVGYMLLALRLEAGLGHDEYWAIHFGRLGASPAEALTHPWRIAAALLSGSSLVKVTPWLATGAFLALRRPRLVIPAFVLSLPVLLSSWSGTSDVVYHYGFAPTLFLALAWLPAVVERPERVRHVLAGCALLGLLLGPVTPALGVADASPGHFAVRYWAPSSEASCIVSGIPAEASVSASQPLTLLAHRRELYLWPYPFQGPSPEMLPSAYLAHGDAGLAAGVDYLVIRKGDASLVPGGFVLEGRSDHYLRYRRESSTAAAAFRSCG